MARQFFPVTQDHNSGRRLDAEPREQIWALLHSNGSHSKRIVIAASLECVGQISIELPTQPTPGRVEKDQQRRIDCCSGCNRCEDPVERVLIVQ